MKVSAIKCPVCEKYAEIVVTYEGTDIFVAVVCINYRCEVSMHNRTVKLLEEL